MIYEVKIFSYYKDKPKEISQFIKSYEADTRKRAEDLLMAMIMEQTSFNIKNKNNSNRRGVLLNTFNESSWMLQRTQQERFYCDIEIKG